MQHLTESWGRLLQTFTHQQSGTTVECQHISVGKIGSYHNKIRSHYIWKTVPGPLYAVKLGSWTLNFHCGYFIKWCFASEAGKQFHLSENCKICYPEIVFAKFSTSPFYGPRLWLFGSLHDCCVEVFMYFHLPHSSCRWYIAHSRGMSLVGFIIHRWRQTLIMSSNGFLTSDLQNVYSRTFYKIGISRKIH